MTSSVTDVSKAPKRAQKVSKTYNCVLCPSQIVFRYERGDGVRGLVALDDVSFSKECVFDPDNNKLPDASTTTAPPTPSNTPTTPATPSASTAPPNPCQVNDFTERTQRQFIFLRTPGPVNLLKIIRTYFLNMD